MCPIGGAHSCMRWDRFVQRRDHFTATFSRLHLRSPELFLGITFDWIEIQTRGLYHCVCFVKAHRLICNMTYINQHMTLT